MTCKLTEFNPHRRGRSPLLRFDSHHHLGRCAQADNLWRIPEFWLPDIIAVYSTALMSWRADRTPLPTPACNFDVMSREESADYEIPSSRAQCLGEAVCALGRDSIQCISRADWSYLFAVRHRTVAKWYHFSTPYFVNSKYLPPSKCCGTKPFGSQSLAVHHTY